MNRVGSAGELTRSLLEYYKLERNRLCFSRNLVTQPSQAQAWGVLFENLLCKISRFERRLSFFGFCSAYYSVPTSPQESAGTFQ